MQLYVCCNCRYFRTFTTGFSYPPITLLLKQSDNMGKDFPDIKKEKKR